MKTDKKKYIIICGVLLLVVVSLFITIKRKRKQSDLFKDTNVEVSITTDDVTDTDENEKIVLDEVEMEAYIQSGHTTSDAPAPEYIEPVPSDNVDTEINEVSLSERGTEDETQSDNTLDTTNREYVFSYNSITKDNYVNFMEQLCCVDFFEQNVDTSTIPLGDEALEMLETQGHVQGDALKYSFITTDQGFNDDNNTFYMIIHIPNETKDFVLIEGSIENNMLASLRVQKMR